MARLGLFFSTLGFYFKILSIFACAVIKYATAASSDTLADMQKRHPAKRQTKKKH